MKTFDSFNVKNICIGNYESKVVDVCCKIIDETHVVYLNSVNQ